MNVRLICDACNRAMEFGMLRPNQSGVWAALSLTPGFSRVQKAPQNRSRFNGFHSGQKLLKQFFVSIADYTGLKPGVNAK